MRDGEQSPGASMSLEEKLQISRVFDELGVDIIEAGFPAAAKGGVFQLNCCVHGQRQICRPDDLVAPDTYVGQHPVIQVMHGADLRACTPVAIQRRQ